jgi:hypothetical protein|tara:strand:+ start:2657 stop:2785 length:129 start_codon:yes stop_codon:yes gene_type:complete
MPVYLRNFYTGELIKAKKEEQKDLKKLQRKSKNISRSNIPKR